MNDVQTAILSVYKEVKQILERHKIPYFAIGGTCIGAVRHGGFIPWDDDLDIAIPVEHFEDFKMAATEELPSYLHLYTPDNVQHYSNVFIKVMDERTTFIERQIFGFPDAYGGVYVDIMPLAGVPENIISQTVYCLFLRLLFGLNRIRRFPYADMDKFYTKTLWNMMNFVGGKLKIDFFSDSWMDILKKYPFSSSKYTGYVWSAYLSELIFPKSFFKAACFLPFEDTEIPCPIEWDKYLSKQFGDYMCLPPIEERKTGHEGLVDLHQPYCKYQKNPERVREEYSNRRANR